MEFFYGKGLAIIFLVCIAKILLDIIGAIAMFIYCNEKFLPPRGINGSNEITSDHKNYIVGN